MKSLVVKRSVNIGAHKSSISIEDTFWNSLRDIAQERGEPLSQLLAQINANRQFANLSSALRVFVLGYYKDRFAQREQNFQQREISVQ